MPLITGAGPFFPKVQINGSTGDAQFFPKAPIDGLNQEYLLRLSQDTPTPIADTETAVGKDENNQN